jgi:hypothetical protein
MTLERISVFVLATLLLVSLALAGKGNARLPENPEEIPREAQLTSTRAGADLDGDGRDETLLLVNALTGEQSAERAAEVVLGIYAAGEDTELLWVRQVMRETGRPAHDGEVSALDLDGDGASELILSWDVSVSKGVVERYAEIYSMGRPDAPRKVWEGAWARDTRRSTETPSAERELFSREIDYSATRRAAGRAIVFRTTHRVIAGQTLDPPRVVTERVDVSLRSWPAS